MKRVPMMLVPMMPIKLLLLVCFVACSAMTPSPQEALEKTAWVYNEHVRWKRFDKASLLIKQDKDRTDFMTTFEPTEETLNIDDLEVKNIEWQGDTKATITINVRYYKLPSVTMKKEKWVQFWEKKDDDWWIVKNAKGPFFNDDKPKK